MIDPREMRGFFKRATIERPPLEQELQNYFKPSKIELIQKSREELENDQHISASGINLGSSGERRREKINPSPT